MSRARLLFLPDFLSGSLSHGAFRTGERMKERARERERAMEEERDREREREKKSALSLLHLDPERWSFAGKRGEGRTRGNEGGSGWNMREEGDGTAVNTGRDPPWLS